MKMKIVLLCLFLSTIVFYQSYGQQQPENPGFEMWEEIGYGPDTLEPVGWNSLKTSDGGDMINDVIPVVWEQSTDAHSGMYSIRLFNEPILTLVAPGTLTNGRVHAAIDPADAYVFTIDSLPEFNTPFTGKPDSLTVWVKFSPMLNDIAHVIAVLHTDTAKIADPEHTNWIAVATIDIAGESTAWTRLSAPFEYLNTDTPEYILFAIYAGDAQNALVGSELYLDDFELIYYNTAVQNADAGHFRLVQSGNELVLTCDPVNQNKTLRLDITDISGNRLFTQQFQSEPSNAIGIKLTPGIYICCIQGADFIHSEKFIIR